MSDIKIFHMVDGKAIIGKVTYEDADKLIIEKPCEIVILPPGVGHNDTDKPQLFFAPYLTIMGALKPFEVLELKHSHVLAPRGEAPLGIEDGYLQLTSGLQIARSLQMP
jgi:hypothetical protein